MIRLNSKPKGGRFCAIASCACVTHAKQQHTNATSFKSEMALVVAELSGHRRAPAAAQSLLLVALGQVRPAANAQAGKQTGE